MLRVTRIVLLAVLPFQTQIPRLEELLNLGQIMSDLELEGRCLRLLRARTRLLIAECIVGHRVLVVRRAASILHNCDDVIYALSC